MDVSPMTRRRLLTLSDGGVLAGSLVAGVARAQAPGHGLRIGMLTIAAATGGPFDAPMIRGLAKHGYVVDKNLSFERRGAEGHADQLARLMAELAAAKVDMIIALGYGAAAAAKQRPT